MPDVTAEELDEVVAYILADEDLEVAAFNSAM